MGWKSIKIWGGGEKWGWQCILIWGVGEGSEEF